MISKLALNSLNSNQFNYLFDIYLYLRQKLNKIIFKVILNYINTFNLYNSLKSLSDFNYFFPKINNYTQDLINIKINHYFNILFECNKNLKENLKILKKNENKFLFINYINLTPLYLKNSITYPKLNNIYLFNEYLYFINKINFNDKVLNENRRRNNINLILNYNISLNCYYDFFSIETYNIIILSNYLSNKDNLKTTSIYHLLFSLINNNILLDNNILLLKNDSNLNTIKELIKNEKIKAKNFIKFSFFNSLVIEFVKLYLHIKSLFIGNKCLTRKTFISKKIKILFQYMIKLNKSLFKTMYLIPEYFLFIMLNIKDIKISEIFLNSLNNKVKKNTLNFNSFIYNKNFKNNNQSLIDIKQQYYFFLLKRAISEYELKVLLNSVYAKHILNYFRFFILNNTIKMLKKENIYQNFIEDILIINNSRY